MKRLDHERTLYTTRAMRSTLTDLESARSKLVFLYLATMGSATINEIESDLGMAKLTLYPILRILIDRGYVVRSGPQYVLVST